MMKRGMGRGAFTLVEISVALLVGVVVVGIMIAMLTRVTTFFARAEQRLDPREGAHLALAAVRQAVGDAWGYAVAKGGAGLTFSGPGKSGELRYDAAAGKLELRRTGASAFQTLIAAGVKTFRVSAPRAGLLKLTFTMMRPESGGRLATLAPATFNDEIFLPAVGQRTRSLPWPAFLEDASAGQAKS